MDSLGTHNKNHNKTNHNKNMSILIGIHNNDVIMGTVASQIISLTIVYSIVYSDTDQRKHQSSTSLAFVWGIHRWPVNSPHKWPVTQKIFPFDDVIMILYDWVTVLGVKELHHDNDIAWASFHLKSPATPLLVQQLHQANNKEMQMHCR